MLKLHYAPELVWNSKSTGYPLLLKNVNLCFDSKFILNYFQKHTSKMYAVLHFSFNARKIYLAPL